MADAATPSLDSARAFQAHAAQMLAVTARAWQLTPPSAQALARRAAYGYVPRRARLRAAAAALALRPAASSLAYSLVSAAMDVYAINRVQLSYPSALQREVQHFYGDLLGLTQMPQPTEPVLRFAARGQRVDLVATDPPPQRPDGLTQLSFEVQGLPSLRRRLLDAALTLEEHLPLPGYLRFYVHDPAGNRLEFVEPDTV